jgi:NAD(P)-dependent dehydrogenase (short-subunit alcohol dehydrogenase family)
MSDDANASAQSARKRTVILTGASRGIGHATVQRFSENDWRVITCSREDVPEGCPRDPARHVHVPADLADTREQERFIRDITDLLGDAPLHALVNNAGVSPKTPYQERLGCLNGDLDAWREVFELNLFAPLRLARGFASALHRGRGAIVNVTSIAGHSIHPFAGSAYSISKAALSSMTREMAAEFAELDVRVNAVAPGEIETVMLSPGTDALIPRIPLKRLGKPQDVASVIYFLCSEDADYVSGAEIFVTGGQHLY